MPKPGTTVETKTEFSTEDGVRKKKTTTVTTTVTETSGGGYKTNTSTRTQVEGVPDGYDEVGDQIGKLTTRDSDSDDEKNEMSRREQDIFREDLMNAVNDYRRKHGASRLTTSSSLEKTAQKHAYKMLCNDDLSLLPGRFGQSLSMMQPRPTGEKVAEQWYEEKDGYDFKEAKFAKGSGNFTQIVWKSSKEIGIGVASDKEGKTYIIALFDPPGNVQKQFADNVKKA